MGSAMKQLERVYYLQNDGTAKVPAGSDDAKSNAYTTKGASAKLPDAKTVGTGDSQKSTVTIGGNVDVAWTADKYIKFTATKDTNSSTITITAETENKTQS